MDIKKYPYGFLSFPHVVLKSSQLPRILFELIPGFRACLIPRPQENKRFCVVYHPCDAPMSASTTSLLLKGRSSLIHYSINQSFKRGGGVRA